MSSHLSAALLVLCSFVSTIAAHGRIALIEADGVTYTGWDPALAAGVDPSTLPPIPAWSASNLGNVFVPPQDFNTTDITCHFNATPGQAYVNIQAGHSINMQWNEWPSSHKGPVMTYLAACNGSCTTVDKTKLQFVKIDELGWINSSDPLNEDLGGTWASDILIEKNFTWTTQLPQNLAPGNYVIRHEIIALHLANDTDGAQNYPQCLNIHVTQSTAVASSTDDSVTGGEVAPKFYTPTDPGIFFDVHRILTGYPIPGPAMWSDAAKPNHGTRKVRRFWRFNV